MDMNEPNEWAERIHDPSWDWWFYGQRMAILPPESPLDAYEITDEDGRLYFKDGSVVRWIRFYERNGWFYSLVPLGQ